MRDLFEVISNDSLSPQLVKRIIAFKFGMKDCSDDLDDFYCDFLLQQARYNVGKHDGPAIKIANRPVYI